jgi:hypothetical protein
MTYKTIYWDSATQSQQERDCTPEEVAEIDARKTAPVPIHAQITALETTVTPRRIREAVLTEDGALWLAGVDAQIATLRAQLS